MDKKIRLRLQLFFKWDTKCASGYKASKIEDWYYGYLTVAEQWDRTFGEK